MSTSPGRNERRTAIRGTYAVGDERRLRILDAAVEHFAQWGFHASSLARIAKDVGITQGGLLHHFRSKEDLLVAVLEHSEQRDQLCFFTTEFISAAQCLATLVDLTAYNATRPGRVRMFNVLLAEAGSPGHPAHDYFNRRNAEILDHMTGAFRRAVGRGELRADTDCPALAREVTAVMDGLQLQWALTPQAVDMPAQFRAYAHRLLRTVTTTGTGLPDA